MNITSILYAVGLLGGIGILAGLVLTFADSKFHVEVDEREALCARLYPVPIAACADTLAAMPLRQ